MNIEISYLQFTYPSGVKALFGVSLNINAGEQQSGTPVQMLIFQFIYDVWKHKCISCHFYRSAFCLYQVR